jgi:hypothetical protein
MIDFGNNDAIWADEQHGEAAESSALAIVEPGGIP